jgi:predicted Zn-dependent peptidase
VHYTDRIRAVTREQIVDALKRFVHPQSYTKGVLRPAQSS